MHRVSMYGWPKPKLHQVKKKLLYPRFSPRQIISFQLHHSQRTLTGVHSCVSKQRLCSRYNILSSIGRKGPFTILHLQQILYAKFYVSQNIFLFWYVHICMYILYIHLYVHICTGYTYKYLSITHWQPVPSAPEPNSIRGKQTKINLASSGLPLLFSLGHPLS